MISKPEYREFGLGYRFEWEAEHIRATVSRLEDDRGELKCEVQIESTHPDNPGHLKQQRFNCASGRARSELAKILKSTVNHIDWNALLEQLAFLTIRAHREGNPPEIIRVSQTDQVIQPAFLIRPFVVDKDISMIYARGGKGKTLAAQVIMCCGSLGIADNGLGLLINRPVRAGLLDFESNPTSFKYRIIRLFCV